MASVLFAYFVFFFFFSSRRRHTRLVRDWSSDVCSSDLQDLLKAKNYLLNNSNSKINDGPISKHINRPISKWITSKITDYPLTPNQISIAVFFISVFSGLIISMEGYFFLLLGALLAQLSSILDGCDGEIARLKLLKSKFGRWLDQVLDRYSEIGRAHV